MAVISFRFAAAAGRPDQDRILHRLKAAPGVRAVGHIDADSPDADIARMCFAETTDAAHVAAVVEHLRAAGAEGVSVEPRRGLAT